MATSTTAPPVILSQGAPAGFASLLEAFRGRLERELTAWLAAKRAAAAAAGVDEAADLIGALAGLMIQGGKRLRPALVYFTNRACGGRTDAQALPLALATEFLHTYLLIHDDIMDHAELRRGQPAAHVRFSDAHRERGFQGDADDFGRSVAILLGDLAHTYAVELFTSLPPGAPNAAALTACFSAMCEEVIGGQYLELLVAQRRGMASPAGDDSAAAGAAAGSDPERQQRERLLLRVLRLKSGRYTAERPIQLGALLAGAQPPLLAALSRYGVAVGEAFQLQDDLLGIFGDAGTVGKPVGADLQEGKFTFLVHHALAAATPAERNTIEAALGNHALSSSEVVRVRAIMERTGARHAVTDMVAERLRTARAALAQITQIIQITQITEITADLTSPPLASPPLAGGRAPHAPNAPHAGAPAAAAARAEGQLFLAGLLDDLWGREQ
ncbi:MAG TPA: polyprenyl synthetase family protein [Thermoanaerobaculia bacterium]|nr:polyprenyl synthetase family protein [Thermoanaerobaculia bacterium]